MGEQVRRLLAEIQDLEQSLEKPDVYNDPEAVKKIRRRMAQLEKLRPLCEEYERLQRSITAVKEVESDPELLAMAKEEAAAAQVRLPALEEELKFALLPRDPRDDRPAIIEVRAGTGGEEAALFASELMRMYIRYAEGKGWQTQMLSVAETDGGGVKEAVCRIEGPEVFGYLKFEGGVHRVQRIPATETKGRIHTSAATVAVMPEAEPMDFTIRNEDLRIDTFRAGGAGGQHVNKTESAVRITHLPTGVAVSCQSERSQLQNRARAMDLLRTRLLAFEEEKRAKEQGTIRKEQVGSGDRSDKIRTYNFPQDRVTDHRLEQSFHNLPAVMEGQIGDIIDALRLQEQQRLLKEAASS